MDLSGFSQRAIHAIQRWQTNWPAYTTHPSMEIDPARLARVLDELATRLGGNYPFFHPDYAGQMLKPPSPVAVLGYLSAMLINPNNHALDGGPPTAAMEKEAVADIARMFGLPDGHLGHLTSSGTIANLEALYVARELNPEGAIAYSEDAHYTHERMCHVLGLRGVKVATDAQGRMDMADLERVLQTERVGTVVLTTGTTPLGAVDPVHEALKLRDWYGVRLHVDAAYGGFFSIVAADSPQDVPAAAFRAVAQCDSVVVDPHKHGLQPYGCGCVLFRDAAVGRFYKHDSPYTYFSSDELHLGEISLECSRAGAAAAALWTTLQLYPLTMQGLGAVVAAGLRAARRWSTVLRGLAWLREYQAPALDIVTYFPWWKGATAIEIDAASQIVFERAMDERLYVSVAKVRAEALRARHPDIDVTGIEHVRILRSVLMKPEHEQAVDGLLARLQTLAMHAPHR